MTTTDDKPYTDEDVDLLHAEIKALTHLERRLLATLDERTRERDEAREDAARDGGLEAMAREEAERMLRSASDLRDALDSVAGALGVDTSTDADTEARACVSAVASLREEVAQLRGELADSERAREGLRTDLRGAQQQIRAAERLAADHADEAAALREEVARLLDRLVNVDAAARALGPLHQCAMMTGRPGEEAVEHVKTAVRCWQKDREARAAAERDAQDQRAKQRHLVGEVAAAERRAEEARVVVQRIYDRCRRGVESSTRRASILRGVLLAALLDAEAALGILAATLPPQQQTPAPADDACTTCGADQRGRAHLHHEECIEALRSRVGELEGRLARARETLDHIAEEYTDEIRDELAGADFRTTGLRCALADFLRGDTWDEIEAAALPSQEQPAAPACAKCGGEADGEDFAPGSAILCSSCWEAAPSPLTFAALRTANAERQSEWFDGIEAGLLYRACEMGGEAGEALNVVKKLERERMGKRGSRATMDDLRKELGDVVICADLVAQEAGLSLDDAVAFAFNVTSAKNGLRTTLPAAPPTSTPEATRAPWPDVEEQARADAEEVYEHLHEEHTAAPSTPEGEPGYDLPPDAPEIPEGEPADDDADPTKWQPGDVVAFVLRSDDGEWRRDSPEYTLQTRVTVGWECWFKDWRVRHKTIYDSDVRRLIESGERRRYRRIRRASTEERRG